MGDTDISGKYFFIDILRSNQDLLQNSNGEFPVQLPSSLSKIEPAKPPHAQQKDLKESEQYLLKMCVVLGTCYSHLRKENVELRQFALTCSSCM